MEAIKQSDGTWDIIGLEPWQQTFERMCTMLKEGINFKFARYGDGEIFCMTGKIGHNCDKHQYFPEMGIALNTAIKRANYMVGIQPLSISQKLHERIELPECKLYNADVLHNASINKRIFEVFTLIKNHVIVGPLHSKNFSRAENHIIIPDLNCWEVHNYTCKAIQRKINEGHKIFILCASMTSEVIIDQFRNEDVTFIDFGSVLDPYCNVKSRTYHQSLQV